MSEEKQWPEQDSDLTGADEERTSHLQAVHVLTVAGVDQETIATHREKVAGRTQGEVRDLVAKLTQAKPEQHAHILTELGKRQR